MNELNLIFSQNLKRLLEENNIKPIDVSKRLEISKSTVSEWCSGKKIPRADKLTALTQLLNCKMSDLLTEKEKSTNTTNDDVLMDYWRRLSDEQQAFVLTMIKTMLEGK